MTKKQAFAEKKNIIYQQYLNQMTVEDLPKEVMDTLQKLRNNA